MIDRLLKNNAIVKIIAVFVALLLWIYVAGDTLQQAAIPEVSRPYREVSLSWKNLDGGLTIMEIPRSVDVVLHGRSDLLNSINPQTLRIYVDLNNLNGGEHLLSPGAELPRGVRVVSFNPPQVQVRLEAVESSQKLVRLEVLGSPAEGFVAGEPRIMPESVIIRGPRSVLDSVDHMRAAINIDGADKDRIQMLSVYAYNRLGQVMDNLEVNPAMVEVFIPVTEPQKSVPVRVPLTGELPPGYHLRQVNIEPISVTIQGKEDALAAITELLTETVDITDLREIAALELNLIIPADVIILHSELVSVEIIIEQEVPEQ